MSFLSTKNTHFKRRPIQEDPLKEEGNQETTGQPIQQFLNTNYRKKKLQTIDLWTDYVKKNFDDVKKSVVKEDDGGDDSDQESDGEEQVEDEEIEEEETEEEETEEEEDIQQRTCSASLSSIIRKDLPPAVRKAFMATINTIMIQVSNYMADFSKQVLKTALLFNDYAFGKKNGKVALVPQEGNSLDHVLPAGYLDQTARVPQPVDPDCLKDADFDSQYSRLFQLQHLELVHSSYFGVVGVQEASLKASPLHKEILQVLPPDEQNPYAALSSHAMKLARQLYETNFQNMWADNSIVNKLLTRLLRCLLVCHLCPDKDREFKDKKKDLQHKGKGKGKQVLRDTNASIPLNAISLINMTRNSRRRLFKKEEKKLAKYPKQRQYNSSRKRREKEQRQAAKQQQQAIASGDVDDQLAQDEIEIEIEGSEDISNRRLGKVIQVARSALFTKTAISPAYVDKKLKQATEKEIDVVCRIVAFIKPYIPPKASYRCFASQLPFVLMANQVLRLVGRESQVVKVTPVISPTSLKALVVDTATLFSLFCSGNTPNRLYLQDYSGRPIQAKSALP